jgi:branched-chain amino acid transport system substrate-binding protein
VVFVQTYSFFGKQNPRGEAVLKALKDKYGVKGPEDVIAPVGTANAYDALHLVALAIEQAKSTEAREGPRRARGAEGRPRRPDQDLQASVHERAARCAHRA